MVPWLSPLVRDDRLLTSRVRTRRSARMRLEPETKQVAQRKRAVVLTVRGDVPMRAPDATDSTLRWERVCHHESRRPHRDEYCSRAAERTFCHVRPSGRWLTREPPYAPLQEIHTLEGRERLERDDTTSAEPLQTADRAGPLGQCENG